jgi:hypothetical protein
MPARGTAMAPWMPLDPLPRRLPLPPVLPLDPTMPGCCCW